MRSAWAARRCSSAPRKPSASWDGELGRWTMPCDGQRIGSAPTDMPKPVAIVAAMRHEMQPLERHAKLREVDGVYLYELPSALLAVGGIGRNNAERAAELVI